MLMASTSSIGRLTGCPAGGGPFQRSVSPILARRCSFARMTRVGVFVDVVRTSWFSLCVCYEMVFDFTNNPPRDEDEIS